MRGSPYSWSKEKVLTDEVIETQEFASEFAVALHDDPYPGANTSIN